jgi:BirA family biotin operon repressor/biotin-[acetyl-CoA-carboxylase] ligase
MELIKRHFTTIDSTNTWCKQHAHELPLDKITLITADMQTAGRGRFKRNWESPPNQNIYATFCFFVDNHNQCIGNLPQVLALSAVEILEKLNFRPTLKWPNDVLLSDKKVAGILAETTMVDKLCVVLGIGLNVNMPQDILQKIDRPATSLLVEAGKKFDIQLIINELQHSFTKKLQIIFSEGFSPFLDIYRSYFSKNPYKLIRFHDNQQIWEGTFDKINPDGSMVLKLNNGQKKTFIVGEILWPNE